MHFEQPLPLVPEPGSPADLFIQIVAIIRDHPDIPTERLSDIFQSLTNGMQLRSATSLIEIFLDHATKRKPSTENLLRFIAHTGVEIFNELDDAHERFDLLMEAIRSDFPPKDPQS